ncbi:MAG: hypothetical protein ACM3QU_11570 [Verrucomicrobiota bacterium]
MGIRAWIVCAAACAVSAAGCGSAPRHGPGTTPVTVPAYGVFPATTVQGPSRAGGAGRACRVAARSFADDAVDLLAHFGSRAAYPADLNYVIVRSDLASFRAHRCDLRLLGRTLERRLTPKQREDLVADLPRAMGATLLDALARAGSS